MWTADSNLFIHAAAPDSPHHERARLFLMEEATDSDDFVLCKLVLVELYMQLRNPALFTSPYSAPEAAGYCAALRANPRWRCVDYEPAVSPRLWAWARRSASGFRQIIDARIAFTLLHHGIKEFATANEKHFKGFGFQRVWNPLKP